MHFMRRYFKSEDARKTTLLYSSESSSSSSSRPPHEYFCFSTSTATDSQRLRITPTMHFTILFCLCISTASAVNHYGIMPSEDVHSMVEEQAQKFLDNNLRLVSLFTTDSHHSHDGSDFLSSELGIFNQTVLDLFASPVSSRAIEARGPVDNKCQGHGNIEDNLSKDQIFQVCTSLATAAGIGVNTIIGVAESKICVEAGTGHPLESCKSIMGMIKFGGPTMTFAEVKEYCPQFLSFFVKCKGADAKGYAENRNLEMTAFNSQKDYNCDKANKDGSRCVESNVG